jgi:hypothetical protein
VVYWNLADVEEILKTFSLLKSEQIELKTLVTKIRLDNVGIRLQTNRWVQSILGNIHLFKSHSYKSSILGIENLSLIN